LRANAECYRCGSSIPRGFHASIDRAVRACRRDWPARPSAQTAAEKNAVINAELPADQAALKSHVMFLASDAMARREAGSHEFDIAAQYVASQFYAAGLKPGGRRRLLSPEGAAGQLQARRQGSMAIDAQGRRRSRLVFGEDYRPGANPAKPSFTLTAPVVFVGYGITGSAATTTRAPT
jgi:hypothetical protein